MPDKTLQLLTFYNYNITAAQSRTAWYYYKNYYARIISYTILHVVHRNNTYCSNSHSTHFIRTIRAMCAYIIDINYRVYNKRLILYFRSFTIIVIVITIVITIIVVIIIFYRKRRVPRFFLRVINCITTSMYIMYIRPLAAVNVYYT